jgi:hypothetical protein
MTSYAYVNYTRFLESDGTPTIYAYQNFTVDGERLYEGTIYKFAPFAYALGAGSKGGERSSTSLLAGLDQISVNLFAEAVQNRYLLQVKQSCWIPSPSSTAHWYAASFGAWPNTKWTQNGLF